MWQGYVGMNEITAQEKTIMGIVWKSGDDFLTAREIEAQMLFFDGKSRNISSLMSVLARLADKGYLSPVKKFRESTVYIPQISEAEYKTHATRRFLQDVHGGQFSSFVSSLIGTEQYTENEMEQLRLFLQHMKPLKMENEEVGGE